MLNCTRREFAESLLETLMTYAFVDVVVSSRAFGASLSQEARVWSRQINEISAELKEAKLSPTEWQDRVEQTFMGVDLFDLLTRIDFAQLQRRLELPEVGATWTDLNFRKVLGVPDEFRYVTGVFGMQKGRSIVPHGHHNLVSGHLVIEGELHVRNFERLRDEGDSLVIRPTVDRVVSVKDCSTQSSLRNNVHWFTALSSTAFTFDVFVADLNPGKPSGRDFIDPLHAERLVNGSLRAQRLERDDAFRMYGGSVHH